MTNKNSAIAMAGLPLRDIFGLLQNGHSVQAERHCRENLAAAPDDTNVLLLLAMSLQQQNRHREAVALYERLTRLQPSQAVNWANYAIALRLNRQLQEANEAAAAAIALEPASAQHRIVLGVIQLEQNDYTHALETFLAARDRDPSLPEASIYAARASSILRDARTELLLRQWRSWLPLPDAQLQLELAHLLMTVSDAHAALTVLEDLLHRAPMYLAAKVQLASAYERGNRIEAARSVLAAIEVEHPLPDAQARIEILHIRATLAARDGDLAGARALYETVGPRHALDCAHYFALAGVLDKLGETAAAMQALTAAHAAQTEELRAIVPARFAPDAPLLPNAVGRLTPGDYARWPPWVAPLGKQSPVFIVGFPRSGTTLLEQMLDAHPGLQSMDEQPFFSILGNEIAERGVRLPDELYRLNQRDCDELRSRYLGLVCEKIPRKWDTQLVDKNPLNMLWLPLIARLFPEAKFILALRHPCDVVLSNYMQNYRASVLASACSTLERTAQAYVAAMQCWLYHLDVLKPRLLVSRYEELVENPARQAGRIAAFLEVDDPEPMLRFDRHARDKGFIATPSYTQVIQPVNRKGLDRWQRYRHEFAPVLPILEPMLRHWGYTLGAGR
ncbi:MAG: sulfotransferase [Rhodanobacter sp.]|jgi:tetratricopeptide (TPR) repeat protein|nr:sulfotransferase [Rhodanobacter sp.]